MEEWDKLVWCLSFLLYICTYVPAACLCSDGQASSVVEHMQTAAAAESRGRSNHGSNSTKAHTTQGKDM